MRDGGGTGYNTDVHGFPAPLLARLRDLRLKRQLRASESSAAGRRRARACRRSAARATRGAAIGAASPSARDGRRRRARSPTLAGGTRRRAAAAGRQLGCARQQHILVGTGRRGREPPRWRRRARRRAGLRPRLRARGHPAAGRRARRRVHDHRRARNAGRAGGAAVRDLDRPGAAARASFSRRQDRRTIMKQTTYEEFVELVAPRHVRAGRQGDHRGPAHAGLGVPEDRRALRLRLPVRERRRRRAGRPLFVPRQGSVPGAARRAAGQDHASIAPASAPRPTSRSSTVVRRLMAEFQAPYRARPAALHRRRGRLHRLRRLAGVRAGAAQTPGRRRPGRPAPPKTMPGSCCSTRCWRSTT